MAPLFRLGTLGVPALHSAAGEAVRFRTRKHFALLIRLAVEPERPLSRDHLIELLWGTAPDALGRHSLAQAVSVLKAKIGRPHVLIQRSTVALAPGIVEADVTRLDACDGEIRGRFLESFEIPGARAFEDWRDACHVRLMPRLRDCLVRSMDAARRIGDFATVQRHAEVLADLDPLSEDALRGIMEARAWVGDRSNALQAYAAFESRLAEELGARPAPELARMAHLLREGRRSPYRQPHEPPPEAGEKRFEPERVVGREREFARLYDAWLGARRREPAVMVLTGDPGVGKTTLTNAVVSTCQMEGAVVARAQAYDAERELPFAVLAELVRQLTIQRAVGAADPEALSELSRICAEVPAAFPGVPKPVEWSAEITPLRLADAFLKTIVAAAEESPLVLVVDDVHAADNASAAILHVVARKLPAVRLLLVLTGRPSELRSSGAAQALTSDASIGALQSLELEPLAPEAARALMAVLSEGREPGLPEAVGGRILAACGGNPLAIELLVREWQAHGAASLLGDLDRLNTLPAATLGIPRAIRAVFERQVARLDRQTRAALDLAAVLGRRLSDLTLYEAVRLAPGEAAEALSRLCEEGLLREVHGELEFRNELIRAQAYYAIAAVARQHLHRSVGTVLRQRVSTTSEEWDLEVGWHYMRAGDALQAQHHVLQGAERAIEVGAPGEAQRILQAFVTLTPNDAGTRAYLLLAEAYLNQSKALDAMPAIATLLDQSTLTPTQAARAARLAVSAEHLLSRDLAVPYYDAADRAVRLAQATGESLLVAQALFESARAGVEMGDEARIDQALCGIDDLFRRDATANRLPVAHYARAYCQYYRREPRLAVAALNQAVRLLSGSKDWGQLSKVLTGVGACSIDLCDHPAAIAAFTEALDLAARVSDDSRVSIICGNLCTQHLVRGSFSQAVEFGLRSVHHGRIAMFQPALGAALLSLAEAYLMNGDKGKAAEVLSQAQSWLEGARNWKAKVEFLCQSAFVALLAGNQAEALELVSTAEQLADRREHALAPALGFELLRLFRQAHMLGSDTALSNAGKMRATFATRHPLLFLDAVAANAWLEIRVHGGLTQQTRTELGLFEAWGATGRREQLVQEGFIPADLG